MLENTGFVFYYTYIGKCGSFIMTPKTSYITEELRLQGVSVSLH